MITGCGVKIWSPPQLDYQGVEKRLRGSKYKSKIAEEAQFISSK